MNILRTMASSTLRLINRNKFTEQHFFTVGAHDLPELGSNTVRVQSKLLGLSAANIAYCAIGHMRGDWDCFAVAPSVPKPYNDSTQYGIAPTWGCAEVLASTVFGLNPGAMLWGYLPTIACPTDLQLKQSHDASNNWIETSERRSKLQAMYNRYTLVKQPKSKMDEAMLKFTACMWPTWESAYLMNRFCFAVPPIKPVNPSGTDGKWTAEDSDLSSALVIAFGAGSRTCQSLLHQFASNRSAGSGPVGVIAVTAGGENSLNWIPPNLSMHVLSYAEATGSGLDAVVESYAVRRIVVLDFGGRDSILVEALPGLHKACPDMRIDVIVVGVESKASTAEAFGARVGAAAQLGLPIFHTGAINAAAIDQLGEKTYYEQASAKFKQLVLDNLGTNLEHSTSVLGTQLNEKTGMQGGDGLKQVWTELFGGKVNGPMGIVVDLRHAPHNAENGVPVNGDTEDGSVSFDRDI